MRSVVSSRRSTSRGCLENPHRPHDDNLHPRRRSDERGRDTQCHAEVARGRATAVTASLEDSRSEQWAQPNCRRNAKPDHRGDGQACPSRRGASASPTAAPFKTPAGRGSRGCCVAAVPRETISEGADCARTVPRVCPTKVSWDCVETHHDDSCLALLIGRQNPCITTPPLRAPDRT